MIRVDGPPEMWAGKVAQLMADRGRSVTAVITFFDAVFTEGNATVHHGESTD